MGAITKAPMRMAVAHPLVSQETPATSMADTLSTRATLTRVCLASTPVAPAASLTYFTFAEALSRSILQVCRPMFGIHHRL